MIQGHDHRPPKEIDTHEREGGRDVIIKVNRLDINPKDEATKRAVDVIEDKILPKLAEQPVLVVVVHKPSNKMSHKIVKLKQVRAYAEAAIDKFLPDDGTYYTRLDEFVVVEHHLTNGTVKLSTL